MEDANRRITMNKKYFVYSAVIIVTLVVFIFMHESKGNYYKESVEDTHAFLTNNDVNITAAEIRMANSEMLQLDVVLAGEFSDENNYITVPIGQLLNRKFLNRLKKHDGTIAIVSEDANLAVQAWVMLTRKGINPMKILGFRANETLKYTFEPEVQ